MILSVPLARSESESSWQAVADPNIVVSVVVPCFNEQESLEELERRLCKACDEVAPDAYEIILVNDGSRDQSASLIVEMVKLNPHIVGIELSTFPARAFDSAAERDRVAELLETWHTGGYTGSVDRGFQQLGLEKFKQHPLRSFILLPLLRMIHYWINIEGAQTYLRVLSLRRPFSTAAANSSGSMQPSRIGLRASQLF
jgi:glycosyltransferase involved in cell wall biosynthesis